MDLCDNKEIKDTDLIEGCRAGNNAARKALYTLYANRLLAVCYRYTGDIDAAHDVLHDAFIKIFTKFNFRGNGSLLAWMKRIVVTQAIDHLRKEQRVVLMEDGVHDFMANQFDECIYDDDEEEMLSEQTLMSFIADLPDGCRTVFNLFVLEGKTHSEIAELLHIKVQTSASQLYRAKYLLAERIKKHTNHAKE